MAKCMEDTWEAILEEQLEEITVLQSIFGDDLQSSKQVIVIPKLLLL